MLYHILSSVLSYLIKNKLTVFLSLFPVTKVWILNSRVMTHKHHRQVSEGHNHSTLTILNRNSPTENKEAYLQGKKKNAIEKIRTIWTHTIVLEETQYFHSKWYVSSGNFCIWPKEVVTVMLTRWCWRVSIGEDGPKTATLLCTTIKNKNYHFYKLQQMRNQKN